MPSCVKTLGLFTILLLIHHSSTAQFKLKSSDDLTTDIKKVIQDHPNQFRNIIGEQIIENPQSTDYRCNLKIVGAEECTITKYSSGDKPIYSWQALMLTTESFNEAKRKFRSLFEQFNNLTVLSSHLEGVYETPVEEKRFTSVIFSLTPSDETSQKLKVEIVMENEGMEWKIKVLIYDREKDDEKGVVE